MMVALQQFIMKKQGDTIIIVIAYYVTFINLLI